ncbi:hypothetical protein BDC45DRAFT_493128, partial [Circinella umbellata]
MTLIYKYKCSSFFCQESHPFIKYIKKSVNRTLIFFSFSMLTKKKRKKDLPT